MKADKNSFENKNKVNRRKKSIKVVSICLVVVLVVSGGGFAWYKSAGKSAAQEGNSNLTYQVNEVTKDDVSVNVSGSGTLAPTTSKIVTATYPGTVEEVIKKNGDTFKAGEIIATISSDKLDEELDALYDSLDSIKTQMATADQTASSKYIKSSAAGEVKLIKAEEGDIVEDIVSKDGYLCVVSTDGKMKVTVSTSEDVQKYDEVTVTIGDDEEDGVITSVSGKKITVIIEENSYTVGAKAKVYSDDDTLLGEAKLQLNEYIPITADAGVVDTVIKDDNDTVYSGTKLFLLEDYPTSEEYLSLQDQLDTTQDQIDELEVEKNISVDFDGKVTDFQLQAGDSLAQGDAICTLQGNDGYDLTVSVDELDIADISLDQTASLTIDALDGNYEGKVTYISNSGTAENSVTSYSVIISTDNIEGVLSGMNATASITTQSSEDTIVVPVDAVQSQRGESFVYLAPSGVAKGDELASADVDRDKLEQVTVTTGMSDGIYIEITGEVAQGDLILVPVLTTTEDGSAAATQENQRGFGNMGGFGGEMPSGGQMPSGAQAPTGRQNQGGSTN